MFTPYDYDAAPIGLTEAVGLPPPALRAREALRALRGDRSVPRTRFDLTSLGVLLPRLSVATWLGARRPDRLVPISNLVNRTPTPIAEGWSVKKRHVRDFRGGTLTYDSHNGTDFAVPVGTVVTAAAPGRVLRISGELDRGGLKVFVDHGEGLVTTYNHLARTLVRVGDRVGRGASLALSGYSGIDGIVGFPWSVPHVHFNVWIDGENHDPFAASGETSLWRDGDDPRPSPEVPEDLAAETSWEADLVDGAIAACADPELRESLAAEPTLALRAMNVVFFRNYYPARFSAFPRIYPSTHTRAPRLTLPFRPRDFVGIVFADA